VIACAVAGAFSLMCRRTHNKPLQPIARENASSG
jgi:hypothetical protein